MGDNKALYKQSSLTPKTNGIRANQEQEWSVFIGSFRKTFSIISSIDNTEPKNAISSRLSRDIFIHQKLRQTLY